MAAIVPNDTSELDSAISGPSRDAFRLDRQYDQRYDDGHRNTVVPRNDEQKSV